MAAKERVHPARTFELRRELEKTLDRRTSKGLKGKINIHSSTDECDNWDGCSGFQNAADDQMLYAKSIVLNVKEHRKAIFHLTAACVTTAC